MPLLARVPLLLVSAVVLSACGSADVAPTAAEASAPSVRAGATPAEPAPVPGVPGEVPASVPPSVPEPGPVDTGAPAGAGGPAPGSAPALDGLPASAPHALPRGPVVVQTRPSGEPVPGTLSAVDWPTATAADACAGGRPATPAYGDLDADGRDEAAVPLECRGGDVQVLVYGGDAAAPRLLGEAVPAQDRARLHAVQYRESHLVVTTLQHSSPGRTGEPDLAVTSRWELRDGGLALIDRWTDPAYLLHTDEEG